MHNRSLRICQRFGQRARRHDLRRLVGIRALYSAPARCRRRLDCRQRRIGVVEHVPRVATAGLQGLEVVLQTDNAIGKTLQMRLSQRCAALQQVAHMTLDALQDLRRTRFFEHLQCSINAAQQFWPTIKTSSIQRTANVLRNCILDAYQIDQTFTQHRSLYLLKIRIQLLLGGIDGARSDDTDHVCIQMIFDADQGGGNVDQYVGIDGATGMLQRLQLRCSDLHTGALLAQSQHA